jgi:hypothetical protein
MTSKRNLAIKQIELQERIQTLAKVNIVTCGHCGEVLLHEMNEEDIECIGCGNTLAQSDCPDFWYGGLENNFDEPIKTEAKIGIADVIAVAERLGMNPTIGQINEVISMYYDEQANDPTATFDLIIENCLYYRYQNS